MHTQGAAQTPPVPPKIKRHRPLPPRTPAPPVLHNPPPPAIRDRPTTPSPAPYPPQQPPPPPGPLRHPLTSACAPHRPALPPPPPAAPPLRKDPEPAPPAGLPIRPPEDRRQPRSPCPPFPPLPPAVAPRCRIRNIRAPAVCGEERGRRQAAAAERTGSAAGSRGRGGAGGDGVAKPPGGLSLIRPRAQQRWRRRCALSAAWGASRPPLSTACPAAHRPWVRRSLRGGGCCRLLRRGGDGEGRWWNGRGHSGLGGGPTPEGGRGGGTAVRGSGRGAHA